MMNATNPANVIYRLLRDAIRLSDWAKTHGNARQKEKASLLVDAIQSIKPLYGDAYYTPNKRAWEDDTDVNDQSKLP